MEDDSPSLVQFHKRYIFGTIAKAPVKQKTLLLATLAKSVLNTGIFPKGLSKVYISTNSLKHMYDKRPSSEYDFIIRNLAHLSAYPTRIYENLPGKRGDWVLVKSIGDDFYLCSIELVSEDIGETELQKLCAVSSFKTDEEYLKHYKLLWSWKGDVPSS